MATYGRKKEDDRLLHERLQGGGRRGEDDQDLSDEDLLNEEEEEMEEEEAGGSSSLMLGAAPSWAISGLVHGFLVLLTLLFVFEYNTEDPKPFVTEIIPAKPPVAPSKTAEFSNKQFDDPEIREHPIQPFEKQEIAEITETMEETFNAEHPAKGEQEAISNVPLGGIGVVGVMGVGGGGAGQWGWRDGGGRRNAVAAGGGSPGSENAVEMGLKWLADHQEADGHWDCGKHSGSRPGGEDSSAHDVAVTGLSTAAFLAAGYTEDKAGANPRYQQVVKKALDWLQSRQKGDGGFSPNNYAHGMATLAASESFGMSGTRKDMAQKAINHMAAEQKEAGGWDYGDKAGLDGRNRSDTSITCWQVMALKSAKTAGLAAPDSAFEKAKKHFAKAGDMSSEGSYVVAYCIEDGKPEKGSDAITAMTMLSMLFLGKSPGDPFVRKGADHLQELGPQVLERLNLYYLYYATFTMFQIGGDYWKNWNEGMRDPLIGLQIKEKGDSQGSWDPSKDAWGGDGGRVYSTAFAVLSLEVYYRYMPIFR